MSQNGCRTAFLFCCIMLAIYFGLAVWYAPGFD